MPSDPRESLPPDLEKQLERLERLGNAEAELLRVERDDRPASALRAPAASTERGHRVDARSRRRVREQSRARRIGLVLLCLVPLCTLGYALAGYTGRGTLALILLLAAGLLTAAALTILYVARERTDTRAGEGGA